MEDGAQDEDEEVVLKRAAHRGYEKLREIQAMYAKIRQELQQERFWRYQRQVSPGLQEYIEALSFAHYLDYGTLISFDEVQQTLLDPQGKEVRILMSLRIYMPLRMQLFWDSICHLLCQTISLGSLI